MDESKKEKFRILRGLKVFLQRLQSNFSPVFELRIISFQLMFLVDRRKENIGLKLRQVLFFVKATIVANKLLEIAVCKFFVKLLENV